MTTTKETDMANPKPATSPTTAIARILRGMGLKQGSGKDFIVTGHYEYGIRQATVAEIYGRDASRLIASRLEEVERLSRESGFPFRVSVVLYPNGSLHVFLCNAGPPVRTRYDVLNTHGLPTRLTPFGLREILAKA